MSLQGRSQEFPTGGGQNKRSGDGSPQRGPGAELRWGWIWGEAPRSRRQIQLRRGDTAMHPCPPTFATPL